MAADTELLRAIQSLPDQAGDPAAIATALDITEPMVLPRIQAAMLGEHLAEVDDGVYSPTSDGLGILDLKRP